MNEFMEDRRLSPEALGTLCYLIANPEDASINRLRRRFKRGKDRTQRIMLELISAGYLVRDQERCLPTMRFGTVTYRIVVGGTL